MIRSLAVALAVLAVALPAASADFRWWPHPRPHGPRPPAAGAITIGDRVNYTRGRYLAYAGPWGLTRPQQAAWKRGAEYEDSFELVPSDFAARGAVTIKYRWPEAGCSTGVCGYMMTSVGNYDGGKPEVPTAPRQVGSMRTFTQKFDLEYVDGTPENGGWLTEFFTTRQAGVNKSRIAEIGFFPQPTRAGRRYSTKYPYIGDWTDRSTGRTWKVYQHMGGGVARNYIMFLPDRGAYMRGSIDMKSALTWLVGKGLVDPNDWVNGVAMGIEPHHGQGAARINSWTVTLN